MRPRSISCFGALLLAACAPKGGEDTAATGSTGPTTGGAATGDVLTTGDMPGTGADSTATGDTATTGDTGDTPTTGDLLCVDEGGTIGPPVEINIRNTGAARVFVDLSVGCSSASPFVVIGADMAALKLDLGPFEFTCEEALTGRCGEDPGCPVAGQVTQIEPGATFTTTWSGGFFVPASLSEACAEQLCGGCWTEQHAPAGAYTLRVASGTTLAGCEGICPPCEPDADGTCLTAGVRADEAIVEVMLDYPTQSSIDLEIP